MLSDSLHAMRDAIAAGIRQDDQAGLILTLRAYEMEARNMEERILLLSGRAHVPLGGALMSAPKPIIEISGGIHGS